MKKIKKNKIPFNILMYIGILTLAFGVITIIYSEFAFKIGIITIGSIIGLSGLSLLILSLVKKDRKKMIKIISYFASGILIIGGALLIIFSTGLLNIFTIILGVFIGLNGIAQLILSLRHNFLTKSAKLFVAFSVLMIISGTIISLNPFLSDLTITLFYGITIIILGLLNIIISIWSRRKFDSEKEDSQSSISDISEEKPAIPTESENETPKTSN
jgi:uncharacterized membrane protein HdeD (DUF308 family)